MLDKTLNKSPKLYLVLASQKILFLCQSLLNTKLLKHFFLTTCTLERRVMQEKEIWKTWGLVVVVVGMVVGICIVPSSQP